MNWKPVTLSGWGRVSHASNVACEPQSPDEAIEALHAVDQHGIIAYGGGRSYGDPALNDNGRTLLTAGLNQIHSFDPESGQIVCGPGVTFHNLINNFLPRGFVSPVTPGTAFASIGGAVANDVHGKNHDRCGSFGDHVLWIDLLLPGGEITRLSSDIRPDLFAATIGGVGLTGIILAVCFTMARVPSNAVTLKEKRIPDLDAFLTALEDAGKDSTYSVGWIDAMARGASLGRGILETAESSSEGVISKPGKHIRVPFDFPGFALNAWSINAFNHAYYRRVPAAGRERLVHYEKFMYPLDSILEWNRIYGKRGFYQFQCVLPESTGRAGIRRLLEEISRSRSASFLAVLKTLGSEGRGYLSFPMRGYTLALDFPRKTGTKDLLDRLERITLENEGRVYLAKDACLSPAAFETMYPETDKLRRVLDEVDPQKIMNSDMARRLGIRTPKATTGNTQPLQNRQSINGENSWSDTHMTNQAESISKPDLSKPHLSKPNLLSVEDAKQLTVKETADLFRKHLNPGQYHFLKLLGFHEVLIDSAEGMYYTDKNGRKILDFFGGFGSVAVGHNHPRVLATRKKFQDEHRHEIAIAFMSQYSGALAKNLAAIAPADLDMVFLGSAGSEAVEAALKLAEKAQGPERATIAYADHAFHGKTRGALSVTDSEFYQSTFKLLENRVRIPFGDSAALEAALKADHSIGILILETLQGGAGIVMADTGYWKDVRRLCDQYDVLWIADEVQCGVGRTGRFFCFEYADVVPDIVTLAKSLGAGKTAMGAMIAREPIYMKAYGKPDTALIHGPATFGGIGEACCTAIEGLNILYDEGLIENSATQGQYLLERLQTIKDKYPKILKDVRGQGLMVGIEFHDFSQTLPFGLKHIVSVLDEKLKGSLCGFVGCLLLKNYNILVAFTEYNRNVIRLEPPLMVSREEIDTFADAVDDLIGRGVTRIVTDYAKNFLRKG